MKLCSVISATQILIAIGVTLAGLAGANPPMGSLPKDYLSQQLSPLMPSAAASASNSGSPLPLQSLLASHIPPLGETPGLIFDSEEFLEAPQYRAGTQPLRVTSGDLNGDGKADLVVLDYNCMTKTCPPGRFSILLGNGDGTFRPLVSYATLPGPGAVTLGDFNGDGFQDLVITGGFQDSVEIYLGHGDGTFGPGTIVATGGLPSGVATGDFNNDGNLDLAVSDCGTNSTCDDGQHSNVAILLGDGKGAFQPHVDYPTGGVDALALVAAHLDGDHNLDLAVVSECASLGCNTGGIVSVLLGNGDGTFQSYSEYTVGATPLGIATADFNGDGKADLAIANYCGNGQCQAAGSLSILLGNGNGTFEPQMYFKVAYGPNSIAVGDFNRDGKTDVVEDFGDNSVSVVLGNGDGTFGTAKYYGTGEGSTDVTTADVNGDGHLDLIATNTNENSVSILLNLGDGTFKTRRDFPGPGAIYGEAVGDFNNDGKLDVVAAGSYGVTVALGNGNGTFKPYKIYPAGPLPFAVAVGDFNQDGNEDLAVANDTDNPGTLDILLGNGDGTFQSPIEYSAGYNPQGVAIGDFNGDGKVDVAVADGCLDLGCHTTGGVSVYLGNGDGTFQQAVNYAVGSFAKSVTVGDFNRDGKLDLAIAQYGGYMNAGLVSVLVGNGDGTFQPHVDYPTANGAYTIAVGDFNKDGNPDLAVGGFTSATVSVLLGNGDGTFRPYVSYVVGSEADALNVADFDGDGNQDIVVSIAGAASVLLGNGDGTFGTASVYPTGYADALGVGDFNGDNLLDIVTVDGQQSISVLLNTGIAPR